MLKGKKIIKFAGVNHTVQKRNYKDDDGNHLKRLKVYVVLSGKNKSIRCMIVSLSKIKL